MTDTTTTDAPTEVPTPVAVPTAPTEATVAEPAPAPKRSKGWLGVLAAVMVMAVLAGATAVLFVRVQEAQDRADEAVVLAGSQDDALDARLADLDATLASIESSGSATADDVSAARDQVSALRKCVNTALDAWSQATQAGKAVSITKC
jgi:type II secretory pathway pseudopilin PulG